MRRVILEIKGRNEPPAVLLSNTLPGVLRKDENKLNRIFGML
jgi:hypothetical protein